MNGTSGFTDAGRFSSLVEPINVLRAMLKIELFNNKQPQL